MFEVKMKASIILMSFFVIITTSSAQIYDALNQTEMLSIPISPNLFNWTFQDFDQQFRFHVSLKGKPELPEWLCYMYSSRHHSGFIFGTPPYGTKSPITLEIIGLNRQDFEARRAILTLKLHPRKTVARHEVELKIDNLNVEDLLDDHRMTRLKDIFKTKLWPESSQDLYTTFLASAIDLGARLPLKPSDGEGLVIRLGSSQPFSAELKRLREEVRPLSRRTSCPREYKRTTVERLFRDAGLTLDWCNFELYNTIYTDRTTEHLEYLAEIPNTSKTAKNIKALNTRDVWMAPSKYSLPSRSYAKQLTIAVALPLLLMLLSVTALTAVLCFHYAAMRDPRSEYVLENIFHICIEYRERKRAHKSTKVELCRYGTGNTEQTQVADNTSNKSLGVSPNNSLVRPHSPKSATNLAGSYNRPQPPPYMGSATNSLHHRRSGNTDKTTPSTNGHTPEHTHGRLALEESLKLLNEANISNPEFDNLMVPILKDPIVDLNDSTEDYVPIPDTAAYAQLKPDSTGYKLDSAGYKPDSAGYVTMKTDLDDIDVPELSKYGIAIGNIGVI